LKSRVGGGAEHLIGFEPDWRRLLKCRTLHSWNVTPREARVIQEQLAHLVLPVWDGRRVRTIAGADIGFPDRSTVLAAVAVMTYPDLEMVETRVVTRRCTFPYVPGLLAFREAPGLLAALEAIKTDVDVLMCDAQGLAHPRGMGLAAHVGILVDVPVVGCAKSRLYGEFGKLGKRKGSRAYLHGETGAIIGVALRTRDDVQPVYVSVGNRIDLTTSIELVLTSAPRYRIPEPLRVAHRLSVGEVQ
jgi:deoxyribonuclease V